MASDAAEDVADISLGIEAVELGGFDERVDDRGALAAGIGPSKQPVFAAQGDRAQGAFGGRAPPGAVSFYSRDRSGEHPNSGNHHFHGADCLLSSTCMTTRFLEHDYFVLGQVMANELNAHASRRGGEWIMQSLRRLVGTLLAATYLTGCIATGAEYTPTVTDPGTQVVERNPSGGLYVRSIKQQSALAVRQVTDEALEDLGTVFDLKVANYGSTPIDFGAANITVRQGNTTFQALGLDGVKKEIEAQETTQKVFGFLGLIAGVVAGGYAVKHGGPGASAVLASSMTAIQTSGMAISRASEDSLTFTNESSHVFLSDATIPAGGQTGASFAVKGLSSQQRTEIVITVGADQHVLHFTP